MLPLTTEQEAKRTPALPGATAWELSAAPWAGKIAVLVTSLDEKAYPAVSLARLYRERAAAENIYDELKNQWGWGGFTTKALGPTRIMATLVRSFTTGGICMRGFLMQSTIGKRSQVAPLCSEE